MCQRYQKKKRGEFRTLTRPTGRQSNKQTWDAAEYVIDATVRTTLDSNQSRTQNNTCSRVEDGIGFDRVEHILSLCLLANMGVDNRVLSNISEAKSLNFGVPVVLGMFQSRTA